MPNEIDDIIAQVSEKSKKETYQPARGEEAIFAAEKKPLWDLSDPVMPVLMAMPKGLLETIGPLIPGYQQLTGEVPWRDPQGSLTKSIMNMAFIASGFATPGRGMAKGAMPKGSSSISKALSEIGSELFGKGGVPATIESGPLPAAIERGFTHRAGETVTSKTSRIPKELGTTEPKQLPQYAGPTAPKGIPQPYAPQTWRERTFPGSINRAQDAIEDLMRESLKIKGMEPKIPKVPGLKYHGIQKIPDYPDQYVFTDLKTGSTFYTKDPSPKNLIAERDRVQAKFAKGMID